MKHIFKLTKEEKAMEAVVDRSQFGLLTETEKMRLQKIAKNTHAKQNHHCTSLRA